MKKDKLERFIAERRGDLDNRKPSENVWKSIRHSLAFGNERSYTFLWKVAAVLFFVSSVILFLDRQSEQEFDHPSNVAQNIDQVEDFYLSVIDQKKVLISNLSDRTILGDQAERDLYSLKAMYDVLKEEYESNPTQGLSDAMILNLLVRIDILNDELQQVDESADSNVSI